MQKLIIVLSFLLGIGNGMIYGGIIEIGPLLAPYFTEAVSSMFSKLFAPQIILAATIETVAQNTASKLTETVTETVIEESLYETAVAGVTTPYNLISIPAELGAHYLAQQIGFTKGEAKVASTTVGLGTTGGIGFVFGGPAGAAAAVGVSVIGRGIWWGISSVYKSLQRYSRDKIEQILRNDHSPEQKFKLWYEIYQGNMIQSNDASVKLFDKQNKSEIARSMSNYILQEIKKLNYPGAYQFFSDPKIGLYLLPTIPTIALEKTSKYQKEFFQIELYMEISNQRVGPLNKIVFWLQRQGEEEFTMGVTRSYKNYNYKIKIVENQDN